jgi:hypothetical protein
MAREMGGDPLVVGKIIKTEEGKQKFIKGSSSALQETGGVAMSRPPHMPTSTQSGKVKEKTTTSSKPPGSKKDETRDS